MSSKLYPLAPVLLAGMFFIASSPAIFANTIRNEINISTNTGGNSVSGDNDEFIKTGSSTTSVKISNSLGTNQSTSSAIQESNVKISTSPYTEEIVRLSIGDSKIELYHQDGKAKIRSTDAQGNVSDSNFEIDEQFSAQIGDYQINIQTSYDEFLIDHNESRAITKLPFKVDTINNKLSLLINENESELLILPDEIKDKINNDMLLDELTDTLEIILENGQPVYNIEGIINRKLFGLFPVTINKTISISTNSGEIVSQSFDNFIDQLTFALSL